MPPSHISHTFCNVRTSRFIFPVVMHSSALIHSPLGTVHFFLGCYWKAFNTFIPLCNPQSSTRTLEAGLNSSTLSPSSSRFRVLESLDSSGGICACRSKRIASTTGKSGSIVSCTEPPKANCSFFRRKSRGEIGGLLAGHGSGCGKRAFSESQGYAPVMYL
jgi:hypothetical protein